MAGQLDSRLRQFFSIGLISSAEKTELRQRPDSQAKIASFLNLISQKKWFLAPFLRVLDKTHLLYLANFTRRTVGLNPNAEGDKIIFKSLNNQKIKKFVGQSDGVDRREAEMLDLYLNDYRSKRPKKTVSSIVSI